MSVPKSRSSVVKQYIWNNTITNTIMLSPAFLFVKHILKMFASIVTEKREAMFYWVINQITRSNKLYNS
jgi:hypothetical protein